jgi:cytochrome P450
VRTIADLDGPRGVPLLGNALQTRSNRVHLDLERWCGRHGPVFRFALGPREFVGIGDRALIDSIVRERPDGFRRVREFATILPELAIDGVFNAEGEDWRRQRRLAVTALNAAHLQRYYEVIRRAAERLHGRLERAARSAGPVDLTDLFAAYTVDVTTALAFGVDVGEAGEEVKDHVNLVFETIGRRLAAPFPYWRRVRLPADRAAERAVAALRATVGRFVERARERMRERPELFQAPENFLEGMLAAQAAEGRFSEQELFGNTMTMLLAGEDTTSHTLAWTSWLLARQPEVQGRLADAARVLLGGASVPPDYETASGFLYGEAVLREAMRLRPVAPVLLLESVHDTELGDLRVPAGTRLWLLTRYAALVASGTPPGPPWPSELAPDDWLEHRRESSELLNFGAGPRFCPGRNLAFLEAKTALATLAHGFEVAEEPGAREPAERFSFTVRPERLTLHVSAR